MPLQVILMIFNTLAHQNSVAHWVRDHRLHHRYSDTDGDPHNASRGVFYCHIGWLLTSKSEEVIRRGKKIDMSDIYNNPVLRFQDKYAFPFMETVCFLLPAVVPAYFWGESFIIAYHVNMFRYVLNLQTSLCANSVSHMIGNRAYDKNILPTNNLLINVMALGDGFHNFHHAFPWDFRSAELGNNYFNITTWFIEFFAWIGLAYDLKATPADIVQKRKERVGDGTYL
nr:acyl-CoA delta(11) desaturase 1 [Glyphodes pyloalis]